MTRKTFNPNTWAAILILVGAVTAFLIFPFSIRIVPNASSAQSSGTTVEYTLKMVLGSSTPPMGFLGVGGAIDGVMNPELTANVGDTVKITVINGDAIQHDLTIDEFKVSTGTMSAKDQTAVITFVADKPGSFKYYCATPGHRQVGMEGTLTIKGEAAAGSQTASSSSTGMNMGGMDMMQAAAVPTAGPANPNAVSIVHNPADLPAPIGDRGPTNVRIDLVAKEVSGLLADGTTYTYFTFNGTVPGPMLRVRVGDTVELHLKNELSSGFLHSIDLHAVTGPGGGAVFTQTKPGEETSFTFQALSPGLFVYHCATPSVAHHIASGMYGLILVEPAGGLPKVDKEFYVMQGEIYTAQPFGTTGNVDFDHQKMLDEHPEYYVFNGASMALTNDENALRAKVGDTVRIFFGVGGPNATSSFHVIGEIFDRVYNQASLTSQPETDVQTTTVAPGGATMVEFKLQVPGRYILVDHALARLERGLAGYLYAEGDPQPTIFNGTLTAGSGH
ncbi:MAG: nitrite reductase, copper-containing [Anaerolineaceae bacterium]|nr:nitrite reductase, copper-containing [Anaerolineaceae bacterium]